MFSSKFSSAVVGNCRELVANSIHTADADSTPTQLNSIVESRRRRRCVLGFKKPVVIVIVRRAWLSQTGSNVKRRSASETTEHVNSENRTFDAEFKRQETSLEALYNESTPNNVTSPTRTAVADAVDLIDAALNKTCHTAICEAIREQAGSRCLSLSFFDMNIEFSVRFIHSSVIELARVRDTGIVSKRLNNIIGLFC